jgi:hypothetical protein
MITYFICVLAADSISDVIVNQTSSPEEKNPSSTACNQSTNASTVNADANVTREQLLATLQLVKSQLEHLENKIN